MRQNLLLFLLVLVGTVSVGQTKKSLTHDDYDLWKKIERVQISHTGKLVATTVVTDTKRGDSYLRLYNTETKQFYQFFNGNNPKITFDAKHVVFLEKPSYETKRAERKDEVKKDKKAKDKLFVFNVEKGVLIDSFLNVKGFSIPKKNSDYLLVEHYKKLKPEKDTTENEENEELEEAETDSTSNVKVSQDSVLYKDDIYKNNFAVLYSFVNSRKDTIRNFKKYAWAEEKPVLYYSKTKGKKKGDVGIYKYDFSNRKDIVIDTTEFAYDKIAVSKKGEYMAYLAAPDSTSTDSLKYQLYLYNNDRLTALTDSLGKNLRENWEITGAKKTYFSENTKRLYFYTNPERKYNVDTTLLKDEIPDVDVWHYLDRLIQPEQKSRKSELKNKGYLSYYNLLDGKIINLQDELIDGIILDDEKEQKFVIGYSSQPYELEKSWESPSKRDLYSINTETGERRLIEKGIRSFPYLATSGNYAVYFEPEQANWWSVNLETLTRHNLTASLEVPFYDVEDDRPALDDAYGLGGFDRNGNVLLYDQFDVWRVKLDASVQPENVTKMGRKTNTVYRTLRLDREHRQEASYYKKGLLITAFNKNTKANKLHKLNPNSHKLEEILTPGDMILSGFKKAENAEKIVYRKQNFQTFPDLYLLNDKEEDVRITDANPQQNDFKWGTVELFHWTAFDGKKLDGLLYKPEDFNPNKKYPVMIYFYEKYSDELHNYWTPRPSASIVNMSYLVSNDYIVFIPDIVYKDGKPGESAYNCIVSGAEEISKLPYVDSGNIAIQGQSWGGYQVAYLVTRTNMFKAAMAGAPVSNMTSAYGGIRWQSGLSRQFQYEKTQSRIGKNLWDGFDLYVENSPLFGIPNVETPLLIMHNDNDGAVPYYQGIEMFMGLRRLGRPAWLLVYNNEAHNLKKIKNKQDLSIRMMQFFDHYLKGASAPKWMTKGIPIVDKGKDLGYELDE
ncbi:dipeptidyl aminopeptidase/acylaminoacyl peptidase [Balneicella halophila]|uniref:Dipeptidyl aminopeptidase/acylaminoacyl peptidase n=1 Tax=Balneicella halophila TaxID=1537566 RepID=A0A7L4UPQ6_BALHA|nr:prolyl oligopeptidase family serine peptidase [Balneicella halophila]PVX50867.1 dipeptidyl aminopeptidase/acylaminoacyl peptidase [Balneicella halophila]